MMTETIKQETSSLGNETLQRVSGKIDSKKIHPDLKEAYLTLSDQLSELADETRAVPAWIVDGDHKKVQAYMDKLMFLSGHMRNCGAITQSMFKG